MLGIVKNWAAVRELGGGLENLKKDWKFVKNQENSFFSIPKPIQTPTNPTSASIC